MKCPSCSAKVPEGEPGCPSCGIVFAKWKERQAKAAEKSAEEKAKALAALEAPAAAGEPFDPWRGRGIAAAVVLAWMIGFGLYFRHHYGTAQAPKGNPTGEFAQMRDPQTGELVMLPVRRLEAPGRKR